MLRRVLGLACLDERRGYAARLSPLLALVHRLPLLLDSPGQSALADVMRLLLMGDLLRQGSPISLRREPTTQLRRHQILMGCLPWRRLAGHRLWTPPPFSPPDGHR